MTVLVIIAAGNVGHIRTLTAGLINYQTASGLASNTLTYFFVIGCKASNKMVHIIHYTYKVIQTLQ